MSSPVLESAINKLKWVQSHSKWSIDLSAPEALALLELIEQNTDSDSEDQVATPTEEKQ